MAIIRVAPFSCTLSFRPQIFYLAFAFRGLHNLQNLLKSDNVDLPPYLDSVRRPPHAHLLIHFLFSSNGGLVPFLAQRPKTVEGTQTLNYGIAGSE